MSKKKTIITILTAVLIILAVFIYFYISLGNRLSYGKYPITYVFDDPRFVSIIEGETFPVEVWYGSGGEGGYEQRLCKDPQMISRYIDALRGLELERVITDKDKFVHVADAVNDYIFYLEDGTQVLISLDLNAYASKNGKQYEFKYSADLNALNKELAEMIQEELSGVNQ
ncbi:MAG: hypothetical protein E7294_14715 [Lachnospiraceae bacterium]|nr:hypothetical protein [Lachnospiraceae bacterium]